MSNKKFGFFALAAGAVLALSAAAFAGVTINGKALSNIDDIVLETTGSRTAVKESLLRVLRQSDNANFYFNTTRGGVPGDSVPLVGNSGNNCNFGNTKTNTGFWPVLAKNRAEDGSPVVMVPAADDKGIFARFVNVGIDPDTPYWQNLKCTVSSDIQIIGRGNLYVTDAAGGLFPYGKGGAEVFAVAYFQTSGQRPGFSQDYTAYLALVDITGKVLNGGKSLGTIKGCCFPSLRIATGDFDHNDKADDIAVIRDGDTITDGYVVQILKVKTFGGVILDDPYYKTTLGKRGLNVIGGCDIAAGDFNKDGKTDIAAVYTDVIYHEYQYDPNPFSPTGINYVEMPDGYPAVTTLSYTGSGFEAKSVTDSDNALKLGSEYMRKVLNDPPQFGILAEAGDLDGDGRDELVFLTPKVPAVGGTDGNVLVSVWGMDGNLSPIRKCWQSAGLTTYAWGGTPSVTNRAECSYLPRCMSLALVPFGNRLSTGGAIRQVVFSQSQGGDEVTDAPGYHAGNRIEHLLPLLSNGAVTGFEFVYDTPDDDGYALGLLPGDFHNETVELGDPDHMVFADERSYVAEIQTPPYHVDYVKPDFEVNGKKPTAKSVLNMTFTGSNVTYSKSEMDSEKTDVAFKTTDAMEWGVSAKADAKIKLIDASMSGSYKDVATKVENATSSCEAKTALTVTDTTDATDNLVLYKTDRHVWRYPVLGPTSGVPKGSNGDCFMTFSLCDTPMTVQGAAGQSSQFDDYNPIHEEGNLFSYPTKIEDIPCYGGAGQVDLTRVHNYITGGGSTTIDLTVSESGADTKGTTTTSKKAVNGSVSVSIPIPKILNIGASATAAYSRELTNTDTFTKSYTSSEKFTVNLKSGQLGFLPSYVTHLIKTQLYTDLAGVMKVGFAVDLQDSDAVAWRRDGMYGTSPDIALVLPARFGRLTSVVDNVTRVVWAANKDRKSAIQLRGIWFRDADGDVVTSALVRGQKYTIEIPVYNASFMAPGQTVDLAVDLRKTGNTEAEDVIFRTVANKSFDIDGWTKDTKANKAMVSFDWTVPEDLTPDNYDLYFTIDPKDEIKELHEKWDAEKDPGGNNVGRYPVAILEKAPEVVTAGAVKIAATSENDFRIFFRPIRSDDTREWLTLAEFRDELPNAESRDVTGSDGETGKTNDFRAFAKVIYSGSDTLTNLYMDVMRLDPDGTQNRIASRVIPALFPNTERETSFMVSPEKARKGFFTVDITGDGVALHWPKDSVSGGGSSGGGCDAGFGGLALLGLAGLITTRKH